MTKVRVDFFRPNQRWGHTGDLLWVYLGAETSTVKDREREFAASVRAYCERLDGYKHPNGQYKYKGWTAVCPNPPKGQPLMMKINDAIKYEER